MNKRLLKIVIFILLFSGNAIGQQWYLSPVYHGRNVYAVSIVDRADIIAGGGNEQNDSLQDIFNSTSGGMTWDFSDDQGGGYIRSMDFSDTLNGLAVGYAGKILKTTNGAVSWSRVYPPGVFTHRNYTTVIYQDAQTVFAFGGRNYTNDTIQTIIKSTDGGTTWNSLLDQAGRWLKGAYFIDANTGFAVGAKGTIIKTTDGGDNWDPVNSPITSRDFNAVYFNSPTTGYIVGGNYVSFDTLASVRTLLKTIDGGDNWTVVVDEPGGWLTAIDFVDQNTGYIAGDAATLLKTTNGGSTWIPQAVNGSTWYSNFTSVDFLTPDFGVVGAFYGEVYLYSNEALPDVTTLPATVTQVTDTNAMVYLRASINTHGAPALYNFIYSTTPDFSANVGLINSPAFPASFNSNSATVLEVSRNTFLPGITYYYFAKATSPNGTVYGDTLSFITIIPFTSLMTMQGLSTSNTTATLNGSIRGASQPVNLFFEYGTTSQLGTEVAAIPAVVNDTAITLFSAQISALQPNTVYYFRVKGVIQSIPYYGSINSFFSGTLFTAFQTDSASNVTQTSARLYGFVDNFKVPITVSFNFGPTLNLGTVVASTPSLVNDTLPHVVTADVSSLQPNSFYYYRLNGETEDMGVFSSGTNSFYTGSLYTTFQPTFVTNVHETYATLNGIAAGFLFPATVYFEYGTTLSFGYSMVANPDTIPDGGNYSFSAQINNLVPHTQYFYRLRAVMASGTVYTSSSSFYTGATSSELVALVASEVAHTSAKLNGKIYHFMNPVQLSFEYGSTELLGTEVPSIPGVISDSLFHKFSAPITGLLDNSVYYYRVKAISGNSIFYSDIRKLYTGTSEVVNWDFQDWDQDTVLLPLHWNISNENVTRVPGHSGNYALSVSGKSFALLGIMRDDAGSNGQGPKFRGGCPFTDRPDSVIFYLNHTIDPLDSAMMLVYLHAGDSVVSKDFNIITGNSNGNFVRMAYPIHYESSLVPDSLILAFIPFNTGSELPPHGLNNFMIVDDISFSPPASLPVCNGGFEDWFAYDYPQLGGWHYLHTVFIDPNDFQASHTVLQTINNPPDDYAAQLRNVSSEGLTLNPDMSTSPNDFGGANLKGFPVSRRYQYVNGYYKFFPDGADTLSIQLSCYKNGQPVGIATYVQADSAVEFNPFDIKIQYSDSTVIPDSMSFFIKTYGVRGITSAYFDKFSFDGLWGVLPAVVVDVPAVPEREQDVKLYPNPARNTLTLEFALPGTTNSLAQLLDMNDREIKEVFLPAGMNKAEIDISDVEAGVYFFQCSSSIFHFTMKVVIIK